MCAHQSMVMYNLNMNEDRNKPPCKSTVDATLIRIIINNNYMRPIYGAKKHKYIYSISMHFHLDLDAGGGVERTGNYRH